MSYNIDDPEFVLDTKGVPQTLAGRLAIVTYVPFPPPPSFLPPLPPPFLLLEADEG